MTKKKDPRAVKRQSREGRALSYAFQPKARRPLTKTEMNEMLRDAVSNTPTLPDEKEDE